jgi:hypothetical protein
MRAVMDFLSPAAAVGSLPQAEADDLRKNLESAIAATRQAQPCTC